MIQDRSYKYFSYSALFIIVSSFIIYHKLHWSSILIIIFGELFLTTLIIGSYLRLREFYLNWREMRRETRPQRVLVNLERNLNSYVIIHLKEDCIICLEELYGAIQLKCGHIYHRYCIDQMIEYNIHLCPLCREEMV